MSANSNIKPTGLPAGELESIFLKANVLTDSLSNAKSAKSKATKIGNFLSPHVGREVAINVNGRIGKAKLCMTPGPNKQKLYHFEVRWDVPAAAAKGVPTPVSPELDDGVASTAGVVVAAGGDTSESRGDAEPQSGGVAGNAEQWQ